MIYLIQGVFFQVEQGIGISYDPEFGSNVAVLQQRLMFTMFAGSIIQRDQGYVGGLMDHFGDSELRDIFMSDNALSFVKRYIRRDYLIRYNFRKTQDGNFVGRYEGPEVGTGVSRCVLTKVEQNFLEPYDISETLDKIAQG